MKFAFDTGDAANPADHRADQGDAPVPHGHAPHARRDRFADDPQRFAKDSHAGNRMDKGDSRDSEDSHGSRRAHTKNDRLTIPELLRAVEARIGSGGLNELRSQAGGDPARLAELARLILAAPPAPTAEDIAELDRLIVRLAELEPWLAGYLPGLLESRRRMAPIHVAENLFYFRQWVADAEARVQMVGGVQKSRARPP